MVKALQIAEDTPSLGSRTGTLDFGQDTSRKSLLFGRLRYRSVGRLAGTLDYALIVAASMVAGVLYHWAILRGDVPNLMPYVAAGNMVAALFVFGAASRGNYSASAIVSTRRQLRSVVIFWSLSFLSLALFLFLAKSGPDFSRGTIVIFGVLGFVLLLGSNLWISASLKKALARGTLAGDQAITIGDRDTMLTLSHESLLQKAGAREIRRYLLPPLTESTYEDIARVVDEAIQFTRSNSVDCVLLALQWNDEHRRNLICERLQIVPLPVLLLPDQHVESIFSRARQLAKEFTVELQRPPLSSGELAFKRALDVILAICLIVPLAPLFLIVGLLIKLESSGPVIFSQRRKGFNGREFTILKFRSMSVLEDGHAIVQARRNDPRLTRVGRILRATSVDELPQLLNVLCGHMSLVGPRPHAVAHDDSYTKIIAKYAFRQHVKPGLTGWAQVNGFRGETARIEQMELRVECDLWYIKNWSFWLDLKILALTVVELARGRNAY
jgi:undecaprenyl-phosphate galactose phosphotransferase/putative colanic acid biosynthesis UDP-glucose lipid carrier transferase